MQKLSEKELLKKIQTGETFSARVDTGAFQIRVREYQPAICTAIHDGHRIHEEFVDKMLVSVNERKYEEDPFTGDFIESLPITIRVLDSRYNYDLNRAPENCIYGNAWGKKVWEMELSENERKAILEMHAGYYRLLSALISKIESIYSRCVLYDLHSYNYSRIEGNPPLFNIGTHYVEKETFMPVVSRLEEKLAAIALPQVESRAVCDEVFLGKGYQAAFMKMTHPASLCVPLEVKKIFMDEKCFHPFPEIYEPLTAGIKEVLQDSADFFLHNFVTKLDESTSV